MQNSIPDMKIRTKPSKKVPEKRRNPFIFFKISRGTLLAKEPAWLLDPSGKGRSRSDW
jgi:hypothetical protein